jgi:menaquinone-dependent protoporphyrinogen IX oxidase
MRVLIVYASRYGATREIAERVAAILLRRGLETTVLLHNVPMIQPATTLLLSEAPPTTPTG